MEPYTLVLLDGTARLHDNVLATSAWPTAKVAYVHGLPAKPERGASLASEASPALTLQWEALAAAVAAMAHGLALRGRALAVWQAALPDLAARLPDRHKPVALAWAAQPNPLQHSQHERLLRICRERNIQAMQLWPNQLLAVEDLPYNPDQQPDDFQAFKVRTARFCLVQPPAPAPASLPETLNLPEAWPQPEWLPASEVLNFMQAGISEAKAQTDIQAYFSETGGIYDYCAKRGTLDAQGSPASSLGVSLASGIASPRHIWRALEQYATRQFPAPAFAPFADALLLRDHLNLLACRHAAALQGPGGLLNLPIRWGHNPAFAEAWRLGLTGIPIVDAAMRQLAHTGKLPHRARQVVAHFHTKFLGLDWRLGAAWFARTLLDHNPATNALSWLHAAGLFERKRFGFSYIHPIIQAERYDPEGDYVRRWLPELALLQAGKIHVPWVLPTGRLAEKGIRLGETYPTPIIDLDQAILQNEIRYKRAFQEVGLNYGKPLIRKFVPTAREKSKKDKYKM